KIKQKLQRLSLEEEDKEIVASLPFLYGNPLDVIDRAKKLPLRKEMNSTLHNLEEIYQVLASYGVANHVVIDLSLINHMDYYSDMIFQGFIENVGKPILMGGRYNTLANQFEAEFTAIVFACDIDLLITGIEQSALPIRKPMDVILSIDKNVEKVGLQLANRLRNEHYNVLVNMNTEHHPEMDRATCTITMTDGKNRMHIANNNYSFSTQDEVLSLLQQVRERK